MIAKNNLDIYESGLSKFELLIILTVILMVLGISIIHILELNFKVIGIPFWLFFHQIIFIVALGFSIYYIIKEEEESINEKY